MANIAEFTANVKGKAVGWLGEAYGGVVEEIGKHTVTDAEVQGKGSAAMFCIGWTAIENHMAFTETEVFKENVGLLIEEGSSAEMVS